MKKKKIEKEKRIIEQMIRLYCLHKEKNEELCDECNELLLYARQRLDRCTFGEKNRHADNALYIVTNPK